jgi:SAM-dependent methyltransferase
MDLASAERFTSRVADYVRYRPDYPAAATDRLASELGLAPGATVADVGAGTGLLTMPLARTGADVVAIDPNEHMLDAAREYLREQERVRFVVGTAEATGLPDRSVDAITAGQAFHWFDHARARTECQRILRPNGKVALIWNAKAFETSAFLAGYEQLLETHVPEFAEVRHETSGDEEIVAFFGAQPRRLTFPHEQRFDWDGVLGRVMSSSYAPRPGHPSHDVLVGELRRLFDEHADDGTIVWPYTTTLYVGSLSDDRA